MSAADQVVAALRDRRYRYRDEASLHVALSAALEDCGIEHLREQRIVGGRIDFLIGAVGMEVKVKGSLAALVRQMEAYGPEPQIEEFVVFSTRLTHRAVPRMVAGKPLRVVTTGGMS